MGACLEKSVDLRPPYTRAKKEGSPSPPTTTGMECNSAISATGLGPEADTTAGLGQDSRDGDSKTSSAVSTMNPSGSDQAGSVVARAGATGGGAGGVESPRSLSAWLKEVRWAGEYGPSLVLLSLLPSEVLILSLCFDVGGGSYSLFTLSDHLQAAQDDSCVTLQLRNVGPSDSILLTRVCAVFVLSTYRAPLCCLCHLDSLAFTPTSEL